MLIQDKYPEGKLKVFKLVSGEEIVGKVKQFDPGRNTVWLQEPLSVQIIDDGRNGYAKTLTPWLMLAPQGSPDLELDNVLGSIDAPDEVVKAWTTKTSGIVLAKG